jgi:hypothetical protein
VFVSQAFHTYTLTETIFCDAELTSGLASRAVAVRKVVQDETDDHLLIPLPLLAGLFDGSRDLAKTTACSNPCESRDLRCNGTGPGRVESISLGCERSDGLVELLSVTLHYVSVLARPRIDGCIARRLGSGRCSAGEDSSSQNELSDLHHDKGLS